MNTVLARFAAGLALLAFLLPACPIAMAATGRHVTKAAANTALQSVPGLGALSFPTSSTNAQAQAAFIEGMLLLHVFEYPRAEQAFRKAQRLEPGLAMAYWGEAMCATHPVWNQQDMAAGRAALAKLGDSATARVARAPTAREKAYLASVEVLYGEGSKLERDQRYEQAMAKLASDFPKDDEASLFHSLALLGLGQGERDLPNFLRAAEIAEAVFQRNPRHPGAAHYWIHGMDDPAHAAGALEAAHALSKIAPTAPHAQHMTAHIFMALGMWDEVVAANEAAMQVAHAELKAKGLPLYTCGHYAEWLQYAYFQLGREAEGFHVLSECQRRGGQALSYFRAHPEQPFFSMRTPAAFEGRLQASLLSMRGTAIVESAKFRAQAAAIDLDLAAPGRSRAWALFGSGLEQAGRGDIVAASSTLEALRAVIASPPGAGEYLAAAAHMAVMQQMLEGVIAFRSDDREHGLALVQSAADAYARLPFDFGPPATVKPPHELLGELLLEAKRPREALVAFDLSLKTAPGRALSLAGRSRALAAL